MELYNLFILFSLKNYQMGGGVRGELRRYLKEKDLDKILVNLIESILIAKPDNCIGFIIHHLKDKFPEETKHVVEESYSVEAPNLESDGMDLEDLGEKTDDLKCGTANEADTNESDDNKSTSSARSESNNDSDSESDDKSLQAPLPPRRSSTKRRTSICAEKLCPKTMIGSLVERIPKTDQEADRIQQILQENVPFRHLDSELQNTVQGAMFLVSKEEGDVIIRQGDDGDNFYIIDSGEVDVYIKQKSSADEDKEHGQEQLVKSYKRGDSFGELAIMYNAPRAASCIAKTDVRLWALGRASFKLILMKSTTMRRNEHKGFLQKVQHLSQLTEYEVLTVADALREEVFEEGAVVCHQGDEGEKFYIIKEGSAVCSKAENGDLGEEEEGEVARLPAGSYFGEIALLTAQPRQATVRAGSGGLKCLTLDRMTFRRVMGPLEEVLCRSMRRYDSI